MAEHRWLVTSGERPPRTAMIWSPAAAEPFSTTSTPSVPPPLLAMPSAYMDRSGIAAGEHAAQHQRRQWGWRRRRLWWRDAQRVRTARLIRRRREEVHRCGAPHAPKHPLRQVEAAPRRQLRAVCPRRRVFPWLARAVGVRVAERVDDPERIPRAANTLEELDRIVAVLTQRVRGDGELLLEHGGAQVIGGE
eukprot:1384281-Prymnesium_polylepis.2